MSENDTDSRTALPPSVEEFSHQNVLFLSLPGMARAKSIYQRAFSEQVQLQLSAFERLESLSDDVRSRIREPVQRAVARILAFQAWDPLREVVFDIGFSIALLAMVLLGIGWLPIWSEPGRVWSGWIMLLVTLGVTLVLYVIWIITSEEKPRLLVVGPAITLVLLVAVGLGEPYLTSVPGGLDHVAGLLASSLFILFILTGYVALLDQVNIYWMVGVLVVSALVTYGILRVDLPFVPPYVEQTLEAGFVMGTSFTALLVGLNGIDRSINRAIFEIKARWYPSDEIVQTLAEALVMLECDDWSDPSIRARVSDYLQWVTKGFERDLPRSMFIRDPRTAEWLHRRLIEIGGHFRQLAQETLLAKMDTRKRLIDQIRDQLPFVIEGRWGDLARVEGAVDLAPRKKAAEAIRHSLSIFVPLVAFAVFTLWPGLLPENIRNAALVTALGWGVGGLMTWLDPNVEAKMSASKISDILKKPKDAG